MEVHTIISQSTMKFLEDALLSKGNSLRTKRDKRNNIQRIGVFGYLKGEGPSKEEPEPVIVCEYVWRPNAI